MLSSSSSVRRCRPLPSSPGREDRRLWSSFTIERGREAREGGRESSRLWDRKRWVREERWPSSIGSCWSLLDERSREVREERPVQRAGGSRERLFPSSHSSLRPDRAARDWGRESRELSPRSSTLRLPSEPREEGSRLMLLSLA